MLEIVMQFGEVTVTSLIWLCQMPAEVANAIYAACPAWQWDANGDWDGSPIVVDNILFEIVPIWE